MKDNQKSFLFIGIGDIIFKTIFLKTLKIDIII